MKRKYTKGKTELSFVFAHIWRFFFLISWNTINFHLTASSATKQNVLIGDVISLGTKKQTVSIFVTFLWHRNDKIPFIPNLLAFWHIGAKTEQQQTKPSSRGDRQRTVSCRRPQDVHLFQLVPFICSHSLTSIHRSNRHLNCLTSQYNHTDVLSTSSYANKVITDDILSNTSLSTYFVFTWHMCTLNKAFRVIVVCVDTLTFNLLICTSAPRCPRI